MHDRRTGPAQDRAHPFKHVGGRIYPGHPLQPGRQDLKGVKDAGDRLKEKDHAPGQNFRLLTEPHDQRRR